MEGARSSDNCYKLLHPHTCVVRGIPKLKKKQLAICGSCQLGKQLTVSHKMLQHITTI